MHTTQLYFECHLTFEPIMDESRLAQLKEIAAAFKFRVATLIMVKGERPNDRDSFMTTRSDSFIDIENRMVECIRVLRSYNYRLIRYKIENTLLDSKFSDTLALL